MLYQKSVHLIVHNLASLLITSILMLCRKFSVNCMENYTYYILNTLLIDYVINYKYLVVHGTDCLIRAVHFVAVIVGAL